MKCSTQESFFVNESYLDEEDWFSSALDALGVNLSPGWPDIFGDKLAEYHQCENTERVKVLSLFSGGGGLDIGFHDAGFDLIECNELEKDFAATLIENSKEGKRLYGTTVSCGDIREYIPNLKNIDFIIGGPPCQTFSAAGARAAGVNGIDDDRGTLFEEYVRILKQLKPRGFLFENVYRIVGAQGGKPWALIQQAFKDAGYSLFWKILDAADYGVPQFRERLIIVGILEGEFKFPWPTHGPDSKTHRQYYTAGHAIDNVSPNFTGSGLGGRHGHLLDGIPPGLNYSFYTERMGHPNPIFGWRSKFSDYLYKADPETPVRTIKAQGGQYTGPFHWDGRTFTIEELKRLQTFPDNYEVVGKRQKAIHQIGNSVPPQLGRILALSILQQVFCKKIPFHVDLMPHGHFLGFRTRKSVLTKSYAAKASAAISMLETSENIISDEGVEYCDVDQALKLIIVKSCVPEKYKLSYEIHNGKWSIRLSNVSAIEEVQFKIGLKPVNLDSQFNSINECVLESFSSDKNSILVLWKYFEMLVKKHAHKDDLVQLMGYYQYKKNFNFTVSVHDSDVFWKVFKSISEGFCVGSLIEVNDLAINYGVSLEVLLESLKILKTYGYEIRNTNTNKQIKDGLVLIPYSFPTLNERSLQRFSEL